MTASMIEWTLEVLEWIRAQVWEHWPEAKVRGNHPDLDDVGYRIRFRDQGKQYWLVLSEEAILSASVSDVTSLLESDRWMDVLKEAGQIVVGVHDDDSGAPVLVVQQGLGPEVHIHHAAHAEQAAA